MTLWGTYLTNCEAGGVGVSTAPETLTAQAESTLMTEWTSERRRGCDLVYEGSLRITLNSKKTRGGCGVQEGFSSSVCSIVEED